MKIERVRKILENMGRCITGQCTTSLLFKLTLEYVADLKVAFLLKDTQKPLNMSYLYVWIK